MSSSPNLSLPLLSGGQAQKHVTVNEAMAILDGIAQLRLVSVSETIPPGTIEDGACYAVAAGASGDWAGHEGLIAIGSGGGWVFVTPQEGWTAWVIGEGAKYRFQDTSWLPDQLSSAPSGAAARLQTVEVIHNIQSGGGHDTGLSIPMQSMVYAVSARVLDEITGSLSSWRLGSSGAADRFGSSLGTSQGSYANGVLGSPLTYYSTEPIRVTPSGGTFSGGRIRLAAHYMTFDLPGA